MKKPNINAIEWYRLDSIEREKYTPRKLTYEDYKELNRIGQLQVKRGMIYTIEKARLQYAVENTSDKKRNRFLKKYGGNNLGTRNKALIITDEARIKYATSKATSKFYGEIRIKGSSGKGSRGGVRDLGWYINVARHANVDEDTLNKLDIVASNLSFAELQQLYAELPDLTIYYPTELDKRTNDLETEFNDKINSAIDDYLYELRKNNPKKYDSIWEAIDASENEAIEEYDEDDWDEEY